MFSLKSTATLFITCNKRFLSSVSASKTATKRLIVPLEGDGMRVDHFLQKFAGLKAGDVRNMTKAGDIKIQWPLQGREKGRTRAEFCRIGDKLMQHAVFTVPESINFTVANVEAVSSAMMPSAVDLDTEFRILVLYDDEHMTIIDKPFGVDLHRMDQEKLMKYWGCRDVITPLEPHVAGVAILSKSVETSKLLLELMAGGKIVSEFVALLLPPEVPLAKSSGLIKGPVTTTRDPVAAKEASDHANEAVSITKFNVIDSDDAGMWVHFTLTDMRSYQIRSHCSNYLKAPLFGDRRFGSSWNYLLRRRFELMASEAASIPLHCHSVSTTLPHPVRSGATVTAKAPAPSHMARSWGIWRDARLQSTSMVRLSQRYEKYIPARPGLQPQQKQQNSNVRRSAAPTPKRR